VTRPTKMINPKIRLVNFTLLLYLGSLITKAAIKTLKHFDDFIMICKTKLRWLIDLKEKKVEKNTKTPERLKKNY